MKRSRTATLLLMSTAPLLLTACSSNEETAREGLYTSVESCVSQTQDRATCQQAFDKATQDSAENSPHFATREECAAGYDWDRCEERRDSSGHSFFGPMMTGFFLSQMMRNGSPMTGFTSGPAFRDAGGQWQRPDQNYGGVYRNTGGTPNMVPVSATPDRAITTSRGGFGSSSGERGGGS
ncbi:DUF1190 domain-containing protein [Dyella subtropica]|uniref:DUF1190 domain-containing protein n=1 Tax=Dyella subtropica TaxID=2992127 RepID=UPI0022582661|nr:DUF1190 domain-containing protein [Dyella subtropica]